MPWVKLDDKFPYHRKVILAGLEARALYITALCHCADQLTDGFVDEGVLPVMAALTGIQDISKCAIKLVEVGLWENAIGGYIVHDYHDYNPTREEVMAIRSERAEAGRTGGKRSGESKREAKEKQFALDLLDENEANGEAKMNPVPVPVPVPVPDSGSQKPFGASAPVEEQAPQDLSFAQTPSGAILEEKLTATYKSKNRRPPKGYANGPQRDAFQEVFEKLGHKLPNLLDSAMQSDITDRARLLKWLQGCASKNGKDSHANTRAANRQEYTAEDYAAADAINRRNGKA